MNTNFNSPMLQLQPSRPRQEPLEELRASLLAEPRSIPPKYFYDARGAELFDRICETPEYYPTRTEDDLLRHHAATVVDACRPAELLELGPGNARKTRHLLNACEAQGHHCDYVPLDVCETYLEQLGAELQNLYPWLGVNPLAGDYNAGLANLPKEMGENPKRLVLFLGGTVGNLSDEHCRLLLNEIRALMPPGGHLLLGADRSKDPALLEAAYNDAQGLTAEFNLNVLRVLNSILDADFQLQHFEHRALYLSEKGRVEMHLVSKKAQRVQLKRLDTTLELRAGEFILTEISRKFSYRELEQVLHLSGLQVKNHYESLTPRYSLLLTTPRINGKDPLPATTPPAPRP